MGHPIARRQYRDHPRIPPIVGVADDGWQVLRRKTIVEILARKLLGSRGAHGYDPLSTLAFVDAAQRQIKEEQGAQFAIVHAGGLAGTIGFHGINWPNRATSIGYLSSLASPTPSPGRARVA